MAHKVAKSNIFEKFKLNRNLQTVALKMMPMLRNWFSNERWVCYVIGSQTNGGGGGLNHLPLLFCKSVFKFRSIKVKGSSIPCNL